MPRRSVHDLYLRKYVIYMLARETLLDSDSDSDSSGSSSSDSDEDDNLELDLNILKTIRGTRYLNGRLRKQEKAGSLHLAWTYSENPEDHLRFMKMLRVSPIVFDFILTCIKEHPIFGNNSNVPQTAVDIQLAVTLFRMGRYGNAASVSDIARNCGISVGSVELFTERCFTAIEALHGQFVRPLTDREKEGEKKWIDKPPSLFGPGWNGDAYYTRKSNYGLNLQIGNAPSDLRIVDYSHGFTGSAHDAAAFEWTAAIKYPDTLFEGKEFAWGDSAYPLLEHLIPVHRQPASFEPDNKFFDRVVAGLRVRSEHCMGALKGRFQCLRGLRVNIESADDHKKACRWITIAIILHNLVIDVEGNTGGIQFITVPSGDLEAAGEGEEDNQIEVNEIPIPAGENPADHKRKQLIVEALLAYGGDMNIIPRAGVE
ncbi:hypothetical protein NMY22_g2072 [Coprinellus aureogranulatus]|nr:hypothetical protein NMY22_g2072 [Coprinellus aureogranulatus]